MWMILHIKRFPKLFLFRQYAPIDWKKKGQSDPFNRKLSALSHLISCNKFFFVISSSKSHLGLIHFLIFYSFERETEELKLHGVQKPCNLSHDLRWRQRERTDKAIQSKGESGLAGWWWLIVEWQLAVGYGELDSQNVGSILPFYFVHRKDKLLFRFFSLSYFLSESTYVAFVHFFFISSSSKGSQFS